jgi:dTDP-glucose 4,6-dehydratase
MIRRILVTGGAGFIGSAFVRLMLRTYPELSLVTLDKLTYSGNRQNLAGVDAARHTFQQGDIADADAVAMAMEGCDAVVNFAAESHVDRSLMGAEDFIRTNIQGVDTLLRVARSAGVTRFVQVSTDEVYGSIDEGAFTERDAIGPRNPYSASKASGELFARAHFETFDMPVVITRGSNTYGPYQYPEKVLPLFVTNAIDNLPVPLYGDGLNVRDWLYVDDHCTGIDCALRHGEPGEIYNIAGGNERTNVVLTKRILELAGKGEELIMPVKDRPGHDRRYAIDASKLKALGWQPSMPWDEGMRQTVAWYQANESWWRPIKSGEYRAYYERQYADR